MFEVSPIDCAERQRYRCFQLIKEKRRLSCNVISSVLLSLCCCYCTLLTHLDVKINVYWTRIFEVFHSILITISRNMLLNAPPIGPKTKSVIETENPNAGSIGFKKFNNQ